MIPLPAPPADALHILPPASLLALLAGVAFLLAMLLLVVLRRLLQRQARTASSPTPPVPKAAPTPGPLLGIGSRIRALEEKILASKAFREGCHRLAMLLKTHLGHQTGLDIERMTSLEIERRSRDGKSGALDPRIGGFMKALSRRRYGRADPRRRDFLAACEEARVLLATHEAEQ